MSNEAKTSLLKICRFVAPESRLLLTALITTLVCGLGSPAFGVFYGRAFRAMIAASTANTTSAQLEDVRAANQFNGGVFMAIAISRGLSSCISGFAVGKAGEQIAKRLRFEIFRVTVYTIMQQKTRAACLQKLLDENDAFFDLPQNTIAALMSRLARDALNIQNVLDQRLRDILQVGFRAFGTKRPIALQVFCHATRRPRDRRLVFVAHAACLIGAYAPRRLYPNCDPKLASRSCAQRIDCRSSFDKCEPFLCGC